MQRRLQRAGVCRSPLSNSNYLRRASREAKLEFVTKLLFFHEFDAHSSRCSEQRSCRFRSLLSRRSFWKRTSERRWKCILPRQSKHTREMRLSTCFSVRLLSRSSNGEMRNECQPCFFENACNSKNLTPNSESFSALSRLRGCSGRSDDNDADMSAHKQNKTAF